MTLTIKTKRYGQDTTPVYVDIYTEKHTDEEIKVLTTSVTVSVNLLL